jgi:hypothetical protein
MDDAVVARSRLAGQALDGLVRNVANAVTCDILVVVGRRLLLAGAGMAED